MAFKYACFIVTQALKVLTDAGLTSGKTDLRYVPSAKPGIVISRRPRQARPSPLAPRWISRLHAPRS